MEKGDTDEGRPTRYHNEDGTFHPKQQTSNLQNKRARRSILLLETHSALSTPSATRHILSRPPHGGRASFIVFSLYCRVCHLTRGR